MLEHDFVFFSYSFLHNIRFILRTPLSNKMTQYTYLNERCADCTFQMCVCVDALKENTCEALK